MTPETLDRYAPGTTVGGSVAGSGGIPALRTLRASEALDEALRTYRVLAPVLLRRSAVPAVFVLASALFWTRVFGPRLLTTTNPGSTSAQVAEAGFILAVGLLVATPLFVFGVTEATLQAVALVAPTREGRRPDPEAAALAARRAFPRAFGAGLWTFALVAAIPLASFGLMAAGTVLSEGRGNDGAALLAGFGVLGLFVGFPLAVWAGGAHALAPAAALRGEGPLAACRRSHRLMGPSGRVLGGYGTVWTVVTVLGLAALSEWAGLALAQSLMPMVASLPGSGLFAEALSLAVPFLIAWTLLPLWGTAVAVMDAERRVRKEGHDVEILYQG